jgi:predicted nucleic acid-binding protein
VGLIRALGPGRSALDTAVFIYFIEEHSDYLPLVAPLFEETARGKRELVTSALTLLEVLVVPYRNGDGVLADQYEAFLTRSRGLHLVGLDRPQLHAAAQLRAAYRVRTPDALQLAAALSRSCTSFVTNDRDVPAPPGLRVVQLREYLPKS